MTLPSLHSALTLSLAAALDDNPFYQAITRHFPTLEQRRQALVEYFSYSMDEAARLGRCITLPGDERGAALWLLPAAPQVQAQAAAARHAFLSALLGADGMHTYQQIISTMTGHVSQHIEPSTWYLSILGVAPQAQGQGLGTRLLAPTLVEADQAGAACYLETFSPRNIPFYERLGFVRRAAYDEPLTACPYWILLRPPGK